MRTRRGFSLAECTVAVLVLATMSVIRAPDRAPPPAARAAEHADRDGHGGGPPTAVSWADVAEEAPFDISTGRPRHRASFSVLWHEPSTGLVAGGRGGRAGDEAREVPAAAQVADLYVAYYMRNAATDGRYKNEGKTIDVSRTYSIDLSQFLPRSAIKVVYWHAHHARL